LVQVAIMTGVLRLSRMAVRDVMLDIEKVCMISSSVKLDKK
jgi:CBS domain containing-hemolysin-like protein